MHMTKLFRISCFLTVILFITVTSPAQVVGKVWPIEKANEWYAKHAWLAGADYITSNAVNQLEMWQADTFDPETIDKELGWAEHIGFNTMRVFLHDLLWKQERTSVFCPVISKKRSIHTCVLFTMRLTI